jgi:hypothetical protein
MALHSYTRQQDTSVKTTNTTIIGKNESLVYTTTVVLAQTFRVIYHATYLRDFDEVTASSSRDSVV